MTTQHFHKTPSRKATTAAVRKILDSRASDIDMIIRALRRKPHDSDPAVTIDGCANILTHVAMDLRAIVNDEVREVRP